MAETAIVELAIGRFEVREPHLEGWKQTLACLTPEDFKLVAKVVWRIREAWDSMAAAPVGPDGDVTLEKQPEIDKAQAARRSEVIQQITADAFDILSPITARVPEVVATFAAACLRGPLKEGQACPVDITPVAPGLFMMVCGIGDAMKVFRIGAEAGVFGDMGALLKNAESLAPSPASPSDSAQA